MVHTDLLFTSRSSVLSINMTVILVSIYIAFICNVMGPHPPVAQAYFSTATDDNVRFGLLC